MFLFIIFFFFFQAEDGIRDAQESRGLGDVYKRQGVIMLVNAYKLSGTGCSPRKSKEVKTFSVKAFGELVEVDLEDQQEQEEKSKVAQSAYARYHEHKQQKIRLLQQN
eukprot:TRINITY_DN18640_c0_g1_i1.p1 TRINITY_DN18640_c0_g1~~TRINITY_DN18640_c0_g1_i1.p1  ORF type:complete len:108 (-),score=37.59 TRINITY_DN18640_c0_g1_i1:217-540(-)